MNIKWLATIIALVLTMGLGFLWYGNLFMDQWMAGNNITMDGEKMFKNGVEVPMTMTPMIINALITLLYIIIMHWLINKTGMNTWQGGATLGAVIGLIMASGVYIGNMFAMNPTSLSMVDGSFSLVTWTLIGAIVGGMKR